MRTKTPRVIKIKKSIHLQLIRERDVDSKIYLLGADQTGVITQAICLSSEFSEGCSFMDEADAQVVGHAITKLIKKNCTPAAIANLLDIREISEEDDGPATKWLGEMGDGPYNLSGMVFVVYDEEPFAIVIKDDEERKVKIKIV